MNFPLIELLGWLAAGLVLLSFSLKTMVALRLAAICSNVVFFAYGWLADLLPVWTLHGLLLLVCYAVDRRLYAQAGAQGWLTLRFRLSSIAALSCFIGAGAL